MFIAVVVLVIILLLFAVAAAMQPAAFRITRSVTIAAPADVVFPQVNDFHNWVEWSPWEKLDPTMKKTFEGAPSGTGAIYKWAGNKKAGEGCMTMTESHPHDRIQVKLQFIKPFAATNTTEFTFDPHGDGTAVTWSMFGTRSFIEKAFGLVMNMDKLVGGDFEKGLAEMKSVAESVPPK